MVAHPRPNPEIAGWFLGLLASGVEVIVPEIADYEVRRNLLLSGLEQSIRRLDGLKQTLTYLPLDTATMQLAAEFWARARRMRPPQPTADPKELDADVILAAQAQRVGATVVTDNIGHLALFVDARKWTQIP
jgi:predicted nucleic acid-binding protein